jgi:hypothetical protein
MWAVIKYQVIKISSFPRCWISKGPLWERVFTLEKKFFDSYVHYNALLRGERFIWSEEKPEYHNVLLDYSKAPHFSFWVRFFQIDRQSRSTFPSQWRMYISPSFTLGSYFKERLLNFNVQQPEEISWSGNKNFLNKI